MSWPIAHRVSHPKQEISGRVAIPVPTARTDGKAVHGPMVGIPSVVQFWERHSPLRA